MAVAASRTADRLMRRLSTYDRTSDGSRRFDDPSTPEVDWYNTCRRDMRRLAVVVAIGSAMLLMPRGVAAQDEPPRIGPFVLDLRGSYPGIPEEPDLAASRGLLLEELPSRSFGADVGLHLYLFKMGPVTLGVGAQATYLRTTTSAEANLRAVNSQLVSVTPQLSFNFGTGDGGSYLSGGFGKTVWKLHPVEQALTPPDDERVNTFNYGAGARWFFRQHLAFTFDIRWHALDAGTIFPGGRPGAPRATLLVMSAGVSIK